MWEGRRGFRKELRDPVHTWRWGPQEDRGLIGRVLARVLGCSKTKTFVKKLGMVGLATLYLNQELKCPINGVKLGGGTPIRKLLHGRG